MPLNLVLTLHVDALGLCASGAVTVRDLDGTCHAIETFHLTPDSTLPEATAELLEHGRRILLELPEQMALFT